jgi:hypothetical protein
MRAVAPSSIPFKRSYPSRPLGGGRDKMETHASLFTAVDVLGGTYLVTGIGKL